MSESLNQLCCLLVEESYGDFQSQVFSCLTKYGRLSAAQLAQRTRLPLTQVKCGLAALLQHQLVQYHSVSEGPSTYQANTASAYELLRIGRLVQLVRDELGNHAATVVSEAYLLGFATIAELQQNSLLAISKSESQLRNGDHNYEQLEHEPLQIIRKMIAKLLERGYLINLRSAHLQNRFDCKADIELRLKRQGYSPSSKGKKGQIELGERIDEEYVSLVDTTRKEYGYIPRLVTGTKRTLNEPDNLPSPKRSKVNGATTVKTNGYGSNTRVEEDADSTPLVCVSFVNLVGDIRNSAIAGRAKKALSSDVAQVLLHALSQTPCTDQWSFRTATGILDLQQICKDINVPTDKTKQNGSQQNGHAKVNGIHSNDDEDLQEERVRYDDVDRRLAMLAEGGLPFVQGSYGMAWSISKQTLDRFTKEKETLRMMGDRLGSPALRIIRMLLDKGKLDEKTLQEMGLLSAKDLRQALAQLKQTGYVDLQEVPREAQRHPNRTIYLWFHDSERVQKVLLDDLYRSISRLFIRLKTERRKLSSTLEKIERSDVQGNEDQIMSSAELRVLRRWQRIEQWILGEVSRLDESVALLRDL